MNEDEVAGTAKDWYGKAEETVGDLTGDAKTRAEGQADQLAGTFQKTYGAAKEQISDIADKASDYAGQAASGVKDAGESLRAQAERLSRSARELGTQAGDYAGRALREKPLASLLLAGAIGYALSFLIHSPHSPLGSPFAPPPPRRR